MVAHKDIAMVDAMKVDSTDPATYIEVEDIIDPMEERRVLRKLDLIIMPLMALVYFMQYLDKQSINYAAVFGLQQDTKLVGQQFSWAVSLFYVGQLVSEYPAAYLMSRLPIVPFVGTTIMLWGVVERCLASSHAFADLGAMRFLLGFFEGAVSPSFIIITSIWYKHHEHPVRVAIWVSMGGVASILGALTMYGIGNTETAMASWRVLFLICGGLTVFVGMLFLVFMPRDTKTAWFLNEQERVIATRRLAKDRATRDRSDLDMKQCKEALLSPRTLLFFFMAMFITLPTPIMKFSSIVIKGAGYTPFQTMLVGLPAGVFQSVTVWIGAIVPLWVKNKRRYTGLAVVFIPLTGSLVLTFLPQHHRWGIVASTWLAGCTSAPFSVVLQLMASNVKGNTKKSVTGAIFFVGYSIGCICGPQLWQDQDKPRYLKGCMTSVVSWILLIFAFTFMAFNLKRVNNKRDRETASGISGAREIELDEDSDLTDRQDRGFRYTI